MASAVVKEHPGSASTQEISPSSGNSSETPRVMAGNTEEPQESERGDEMTLEFNLSDPDKLTQQLERVDLTEEESDQLLQEAYKVNKQLKMMLKQKQSKRVQSAESTSSQRSASAFKVLPPISSRGRGDVPDRSLKAYGRSSPKSATQPSAKPRSIKSSKSNDSKSSKPNDSKSSKPNDSKSSKSNDSKSSTQRPTWDDRFSCS